MILYYKMLTDLNHFVPQPDGSLLCSGVITIGLGQINVYYAREQYKITAFTLHLLLFWRVGNKDGI